MAVPRVRLHWNRRASVRWEVWLKPQKRWQSHRTPKQERPARRGGRALHGQEKTAPRETGVRFVDRVLDRNF
jgi:hypothetical protein